MRPLHMICSVPSFGLTARAFRCSAANSRSKLPTTKNHSFRWRAAYAATFKRFPHSCILHQRRVPFLLVSRKCRAHSRHLRTRSRLSSANKIAALSASGASRSSGCSVSNHLSVATPLPVVLSRVRMGCAAISRFSSSVVLRWSAAPASQARTSFLRLSLSSKASSKVRLAWFDSSHRCRIFAASLGLSNLTA